MAPQLNARQQARVQFLQKNRPNDPQLAQLTGKPMTRPQPLGHMPAPQGAPHPQVFGQDPFGGKYPNMAQQPALGGQMTEDVFRQIFGNYMQPSTPAAPGFAKDPSPVGPGVHHMISGAPNQMRKPAPMMADEMAQLFAGLGSHPSFYLK